MRRDYLGNKDSNEKVIYFVGKEVERTRHFDKDTLFIVGPRPYDEIIKWHKEAEKRTKKKIRHIYATANMSFKFWKLEDIETVKKLLKKFYITIDGEANDILRLMPHLPRSKKLTIMVSMKLPYVDELRKYDCVLKVDDTDFKASNPGIWCFDLERLIGKRGSHQGPDFTSWDEYGQDMIIATEDDIKRG